MKSKYIKVHKQEIPSIGSNALEFFVFPCGKSITCLPKMFKVGYIYDTNVQYQNFGVINFKLCNNHFRGSNFLTLHIY